MPTSDQLRRERHKLVTSELAIYHRCRAHPVEDVWRWLDQTSPRVAPTDLVVPWNPADVKVLLYALRHLHSDRVLAAAHRVTWALRRFEERARQNGDIPRPRGDP